ncbi:hypothetical protein LEA_16147, partial [human gut metagenome]
GIVSYGNGADPDKKPLPGTFLVTSISDNPALSACADKPAGKPQAKQ